MPPQPGARQDHAFTVAAPARDCQRERFAWIGSFSAGGLEDDFARQFSAARHAVAPRLLWISCGKEDFLFPANQRVVEWLRSTNLTPIWIERPGAHTFLVWRRCLAEFAPLPFRSR
jgi:hypothetical protein